MQQNSFNSFEVLDLKSQNDLRLYTRRSATSSTNQEKARDRVASLDNGVSSIVDIGVLMMWRSVWCMVSKMFCDFR